MRFSVKNINSRPSVRPSVVQRIPASLLRHWQRITLLTSDMSLVRFTLLVWSLQKQTQLSNSFPTQILTNKFRCHNLWGKPQWKVNTLRSKYHRSIAVFLQQTANLKGEVFGEKSDLPAVARTELNRKQSNEPRESARWRSLWSTGSFPYCALFRWQRDVCWGHKRL